MLGEKARTGFANRRRIGRMPCILPGLLSCLLALSVLGIAPLSPVSASTKDVAGLVISYGDGAYSYAIVPLDGKQIDGVTLLERSGLSVLAIDFGGYGQGVCKIEVAGCDVSACRTRLCQTSDSASPFWKYLVSGDSGWVLNPLGASGTKAEAGRVYGWAWAGGNGVPAELPLLSLDEVIVRSGFDVDSSPMRTSLHSTGLPGANAPSGPSLAGYVGAGFILICVAIGGIFLVRRASNRPKPHTG